MRQHDETIVSGKCNTVREIMLIQPNDSHSKLFPQRNCSPDRASVHDPQSWHYLTPVALTVVNIGGLKPDM